MRGIKRDESTFPKFKDEKQWNEWYNNTKAQSRSQFEDEILDINYTPESIDDMHLLDLKKRCMYLVFVKILFTDEGKSLVRQHEGDYNVHAIHKELLENMITLSKASGVSYTITTYITKDKFENGTWNGSYETFILHWQNQASEYENLIDITDRFFLIK